MAEENSQDMGMEDILSSIKNILEEDQALTAASEVPVSQSPVSDNVVAEPSTNTVEGDDVLELSPEMRLDEELNSIPGIDIDAELDGVEASQAVAETLANNNFGMVTLGSEDTESDPFYEEKDAELKVEDADIVPSVNVEAEAEPVPVANPSINMDPEVETISVKNIETTALQDSYVDVEPTNPITQESASIPIMPEKVEEPLVKQSAVEEATADSAVDVSANIISNFAKLFSREEPSVPEPAPVIQAQDPIKLLGDGSKTIEEVVSSVIRQIIGEDVAAHWQEGLDYNNLAHQEIKHQTKEWLDTNLPLIVEKIVKEEIERVMAKVGVNQ